MTTPPPQPFHEPLRATLLRTFSIAIVVGGIIALTRHDLAMWPLAALLVLWFSFGGHWVELCFLNWLRPLLPSARFVQITARLAVWFIAGTLLALGMILTARLLSNWHPPRWPPWWIGGVAFIALELIVHLILQLRGRPNLYTSRG